MQLTQHFGKWFLPAFPNQAIYPLLQLTAVSHPGQHARLAVPQGVNPLAGQMRWGATACHFTHQATDHAFDLARRRRPNVAAIPDLLDEPVVCYEFDRSTVNSITETL